MRPVGLSVSIVLLLVAGGCASAFESGEVPGSPSGFSGSWSVDWCNPDRPDLECGGFSVTLRQTGKRVCGEYGGALVNLRQIDEGFVDGIEESDGTAVVDVRSGRNGDILRVRITRATDDLAWKVLETLSEGGGDISIIAMDELLKPTEDQSLKLRSDCS